MSYAEYLKNKKVAVIGPAPSIVGSNQGDLIDSYDVVCRLNHAIPVPTAMIQDIGSRTDVLYSTLKIPKTLSKNINIVKDNVDWIIGPYARKDPAFTRHWNKYDKIYGDNIPTYCAYTLEEYKEIEKDVGIRPTIGLSTVINLLKFDVSEVYITGLTFFTGTASSTAMTKIAPSSSAAAMSSNCRTSY